MTPRRGGSKTVSSRFPSADDARKRTHIVATQSRKELRDSECDHLLHCKLRHTCPGSNHNTSDRSMRL